MTPASPPLPPPPPPPLDPEAYGAPPLKRPWSVGCKAVLGCFLIILIIAVAFLAYTAHIINWTISRQEAQPSKLTPLAWTAEDEEKWTKVYWRYLDAFNNKKDFEVILTPDEFNRFVEHERDKNEKAGKKDPKAPTQFRVDFNGSKTNLTGTFETKDDKGQTKFVNFVATGDIAVENQALHIDFDNLKLGGEDAPWAVRWFLRNAIRDGLQKENAKTPAAKDDPRKLFKLLKREGDKIHIIMDGQNLPEPGSDKPPRKQ